MKASGAPTAPTLLSFPGGVGLGYASRIPASFQRRYRGSTRGASQLGLLQGSPSAGGGEELAQLLRHLGRSDSHKPASHASSVAKRGWIKIGVTSSQMRAER